MPRYDQLVNSMPGGKERVAFTQDPNWQQTIDELVAQGDYKRITQLAIENGVPEEQAQCLALSLELQQLLREIDPTCEVVITPLPDEHSN